jgi:hypothetical protein
MVAGSCGMDLFPKNIEDAINHAARVSGPDLPSNADFMPLIVLVILLAIIVLVSIRRQPPTV